MTVYIGMETGEGGGTCRRRSCLEPIILNLGTRWKWVVNIKSRPFLPRYPLNGRLRQAHSWSSRSEKKKFLLHHSRIRTSNFPADSLVTAPTVDRDLNVMAHAQKPDFVFRRNGRVHLNRQGASVQSTTGSRGVRIGVVMLDAPCPEVVWRVLATHSIRQFPLHIPSRASPCAITFQLDSTDCNEGKCNRWRKSR
jgi:hypothetical protein